MVKSFKNHVEQVAQQFGQIGLNALQLVPDVQLEYNSDSLLKHQLKKDHAKNPLIHVVSDFERKSDFSESGFLKSDFRKVIF